MSRSVALLSSAVLLAALHATACGGRSPLATNLYDDPDLVGGTGGTVATGGTGGTGGIAGAGGSAGMAGSGGIAGAGGTGTGGSGGVLPTECLVCAGTSCPEAVDCFMDQACQDGIICSLTSCMSGGQPDVMCMLDCFDGDIGSAMTAGQAIYCIMQHCGEECGGLLPFDEG